MTSHNESKANKAKAPHGDQTKGAFKTAVPVSIVHQWKERIKSILLNSGTVKAIDFKVQDRALALAAINELRDELPIVCGWHTVRESHSSQTRTRARTYSIPASCLRGEL